MEEQESFTIKDKRRFKEEVDSTAESKEEPEVEGKGAEQGGHGEPHTHPVEINFASFIFSLGRSAFFHLGEEPDPVTGEKMVSLPMAKETIDIISLLEEKTKGNLTQDEEQLVRNMLYALRMRYVEMASKGR